MTCRPRRPAEPGGALPDARTLPTAVGRVRASRNALQPVELVEGRAARKGRVAGAAVEERLAPGPRRPQRGTQLVGGRIVGRAVGPDDDPVVLPRAGDR